MAFDYNSPAELFMPKRKGFGGRRAATGYRRFATAAEAIRFAVEESPAIGTLGAWMQVGDERFDSDELGQSSLRHACGFKLANDGVDTRTIQAYLGHKSIQQMVRYTELAPTRFKSLFRDCPHHVLDLKSEKETRHFQALKS
jgi:hypothetical protein